MPTSLTSTFDNAAIDIDATHAFLSTSYWAEGIPRDIVARAIAGSLCIALFDGDRQVAFARAVTDRATYAYFADVYVLDAYRGQGHGKRMMAELLAHPDLQGLRRMSLATRDAHSLYATFGFGPLRAPDRHMEIAKPGIYTSGA